MSPSGQRVIHRWNPAEVLGLANPAKYSASKWSCPAQTSQKTRCLKTRDASSYTAATHLLNERSIIDPATFLDNKDLLVKLATLTLCAANHLHQYRKLPGSGKPTSSVDLVVTGWVALISRYVAKKNDDSRKPASSADSLSLKSDLYEEQRHQNSTLAVVDDEALSAIDSQFISQHRVPADLLIKVEGYGGKSPRVSGAARMAIRAVKLTSLVIFYSSRSSRWAPGFVSDILGLRAPSFRRFSRCIRPARPEGFQSPDP